MKKKVARKITNKKGKRKKESNTHNYYSHLQLYLISLEKKPKHSLSMQM